MSSIADQNSSTDSDKIETTPLSEEPFTTQELIFMTTAPNIIQSTAPPPEITTTQPVPIIIPYPTINPSAQTIVSGDSAKFNCSFDEKLLIQGNFTWTYPVEIISPKLQNSGSIWSVITISQVIPVLAGERNHELTCLFTGEMPDGSSVSRSASSSLIVRLNDTTGKQCFCEPREELGLPRTPMNANVSIPCGLNQTGNKLARCVPYGSSCNWTSQFDETRCVDQNYTKAIEEIKEITEKENPTSQEAETVLDHLHNLTKDDTNINGGMKEGNIVASVDAIYELAGKRHENVQITPVTDGEMQSALAVLSDLVDENNMDSWNRTNENQNGTQGTKNSPTKVAETIESYTNARMRNLDGERVIEETNIGSHLYLIGDSKTRDTSAQNYKICQKEKFKNITFVSVNDSILVPGQLFKDIPDVQVKLGCHIYKTMHRILPQTGSKVGDHRSLSVWGYKGNYSLVKSLTLLPDLGVPLNPPIEFTFAYEEKRTKPEGDYHYEAVCAFWNESIEEWDPSGCWIDYEKSTDKIVVCACDHTSFKKLMEKAVDFVRDLISRFSCFLSICDLSIENLVFGIVWKKIKSRQSFLFGNLCIALTLTNAAMVGAMQAQIEEKASCVTVIAFMHFFLMVVMCMLMAEAIMIYRDETYMEKCEHLKRECWILAAAAWGIPAVIVGITIAILGSDSYVTFNGFQKFKAGQITVGKGSMNCWVKRPGPIMYAFLAPVASIILTNIFLGIRIIMKTKLKRVRLAALKILVLTPVLGVTWVLGMLVYEGESADISFASLNSAEGLMVVIIGIVGNDQFRDMIINRLNKSKIDKNPKEQSSKGKPKNLSSKTPSRQQSTTSVSSTISDIIETLTALHIDIESGHNEKNMKNKTDKTASKKKKKSKKTTKKTSKSQDKNGNGDESNQSDPEEDGDPDDSQDESLVEAQVDGDRESDDGPGTASGTEHNDSENECQSDGDDTSGFDIEILTKFTDALPEVLPKLSSIKDAAMPRVSSLMSKLNPMSKERYGISDENEIIHKRGFGILSENDGHCAETEKDVDFKGMTKL